MDAWVYCLKISNEESFLCRTILSSLDYLRHPFSISVFGGLMYWSEWDTHAIYMADKWTGANITMVTSTDSVHLPMVLQVIYICNSILLTSWEDSENVISFRFTIHSDNQTIQICVFHSMVTVAICVFHLQVNKTYHLFSLLSCKKSQLLQVPKVSHVNVQQLWLWIVITKLV